MDINQRFIYLIEKLAVSKAAFSKQTGISPVIISHISSGRNKVSISAVEAILKAYPNINAEFLVLGKGPHFKQEDDQKKMDLLTKLENTRERLLSQSKQADLELMSLINQIKSMEL